MTLNKKSLDEYTESMRLDLTQSQKTAILVHFATEPEFCEWSEQDIAIQIKNFIVSGKFIK